MASPTPKSPSSNPPPNNPSTTTSCGPRHPQPQNVVSLLTQLYKYFKIPGRSARPARAQRALASDPCIRKFINLVRTLLYEHKFIIRASLARSLSHNLVVKPCLPSGFAGSAPSVQIRRFRCHFVRRSQPISAAKSSSTRPNSSSHLPNPSSNLPNPSSRAQLEPFPTHIKFHKAFGPNDFRHSSRKIRPPT